MEQTVQKRRGRPPKIKVDQVSDSASVVSAPASVIEIGTKQPEIGDSDYDIAKDFRRYPNSPEYRKTVRAAAEVLLAKNQPLDFGANGKPYRQAWERELGWRPIQDIRDQIWDEVKNEFLRS